jgi:hypothetical protein
MKGKRLIEKSNVKNKLQEYFSNPFISALTGLIGSFIYLAFSYEYLSFFIIAIGFIIYFSVICLRIKGMNIKIKPVQLILLLLLIIDFIITFIIALNENFYILLLIYKIMIIIYLYGLFYKKFYINNIIFANLSIIFIVLHALILFIDADLFYYLFDYMFYYLFVISIIPYFYNYYDLAKGSVKNG